VCRPGCRGRLDVGTGQKSSLRCRSAKVKVVIIDPGDWYRAHHDRARCASDQQDPRTAGCGTTSPAEAVSSTPPASKMPRAMTGAFTMPCSGEGRVCPELLLRLGP